MGKSSSSSRASTWPWVAKKPVSTAPSVQGILKAGDSHHLLSQLSEGRPLAEAFSSFTSLPKTTTGSRRRRKSRKIENEDLSAERRHSSTGRRSRSGDRSFGPLKPFGTTALDPDPADNHADDIRDVLLVDGQPCISISPEELVALSFVLGVPLTVDSHDEKATPSIQGSGAFGMSLRSETSSSNVHQIRLRYETPPVIQQPAPGGSYSILFAKHMACGSIPFVSDHDTTRALFVDAKALSLLKRGQSAIGLTNPVSTHQTAYLSRLPSAKPTTFHTLTRQATPFTRPFPQRSTSVLTTATTPASTPRRSWSTRHHRRRTDDSVSDPTHRMSWGGFPNRSPTSTLSTIPQTILTTPTPPTFPQILASLPFTGGLPPFASASLVHAARFTTSAGRPLGSLLPLLENLIHKIHIYAPSAQFGPYLKVENTVKWLRTAGYVGYTPSVEDTDVATGAARSSRYVAALLALVRMLEEGEREAVEEACRAEMEGAYAEAVAREGSSGVRGTGRETLGAQLAEVLKKPLPYSVGDVATVTRLVVAAWTWQVGWVVWGKEEAEEARKEKREGVYEAVALDGFGGSMVLA
ncbi:hypothetical protein BU16DRAFT_588177 [Lophium mytilinum]|uniref:Uncharacterized protein n=1 Tax=Lophium mytilinum TaxID=390894 RepID=A0A6A6RDZ5_9PEZI|nr:hypothetical protein BU16DRAFT_588177 [Lophium mytilinum]